MTCDCGFKHLHTDSCVLWKTWIRCGCVWNVAVKTHTQTLPVSLELQAVKLFDPHPSILHRFLIKKPSLSVSEQRPPRALFIFPPPPQNGPRCIFSSHWLLSSVGRSGGCCYTDETSNTSQTLENFLQPAQKLVHSDRFQTKRFIPQGFTFLTNKPCRKNLMMFSY